MEVNNYGAMQYVHIMCVCIRYSQSNMYKTLWARFTKRVVRQKAVKTTQQAALTDETLKSNLGSPVGVKDAFKGLSDTKTLYNGL